MKILLLDIETAPNLAHVWSLWKQDVGLTQLIQASYIISVAAMWYGDDEVSFWGLHTHTAEQMLEGIFEMMDESDAIVHYNGGSFDIPTLNWEFATHGMGRPAPSRQIDLYRVAKKSFRSPSHKLQYISTALGLEGKVQHSGHQLWVDCVVHDDPDAWARMEEYNIQDVVLLEELYDKLLPWITNGPNSQIYDNHDGCPGCASPDLRREGRAYLTSGVYQRYQCRACGTWSRGSQRVIGATLQRLG